VSGLPVLNDLSIPRCFKPTSFGNLKSIEVHNFSDACLSAYGACSYLRLVDSNNNCYCSFVIGNARLAPNKAVSVPRLELTAVVLAVRLNDIVVKELDTLETECASYFWSDSTAVLHSLRNKEKRFPLFVANRLAIIERSSDTSLWHYIPSKLNPADLASTGIPVADTAKLQVWLNGPEFLRDQNLSSYLREPPDLGEFPTEFLPVRKQENYACLKVESEIFDRISSLHKLKRTVAQVLKYKHILLCRIRGDKIAFNEKLSAYELQCAKKAIIVYLQHQYFPMLFSFNGSKIKSLPRFLQKLRPKIVDGIARVGGRLSKAPVDLEVKYPIIIPQHTHFTELLIRQIMRNSGIPGLATLGHCSVASTGS